MSRTIVAQYEKYIPRVDCGAFVCTFHCCLAANENLCALCNVHALQSQTGYYFVVRNSLVTHWKCILIVRCVTYFSSNTIYSVHDAYWRTQNSLKEFTFVFIQFLFQSHCVPLFYHIDIVRQFEFFDEKITHENV